MMPVTKDFLKGFLYVINFIRTKTMILPDMRDLVVYMLHKEYERLEKDSWDSDQK